MELSVTVVVQDGIISAEEIEILENFGKKIVQTTSHVPRVNNASVSR